MRRIVWVLVAGVLVAACGTDPPDTAVPPLGTAAPSATGTTPPPAGAGEQALPVYYVNDTAAGPRLQREFRRVATADPASDAVRTMLAEPTGLDPDYRTLWPAGTALREPVTTGDGVITVDLTGVTPGAQVGTAGAELTVQQLVYTVQGALQSSDPVRILLDGEPVDELFGAVSTAEPVERGDIFAVRSLVQIDAPAEGATVGPEVQVSGEAAVFEATLLWEVRSGDEVVESGVTSTAEGQTFAPFSFSVTLDPGGYVVQIMESDPSDGEGRPVLVDDKEITVR